MKQKLFYTIICLVFFISGCVRSTILDEIMFLSILGYSYKNENEICITASTPTFLTDQPAKNIIIKTVSEKNHHGIDKLQKFSNFPIKTGNLMVTVFDDQIAEKQGIIDYVLFLKRDPYIGARLYLAVVEGDVDELLSGSYGLRGNGHYIQNLLEQNIERRNLPESNLHFFLFNYYQQGKDSTLPILKQVNSEKLKINGLALFKGDKMVGKIHNKQLFFVKLLADKHSEGTLHLQEKNKEIIYENINSDVKLELVQRDPYVINLNIQIKGILRDYMDDKLNEKTLEKAEKLLAEKVKKEANDLIKKFQELNVDPIGIGAFVKSKTRGFDFSKWEDGYENIIINVNVDVKVLDTGTTG